MRTCDNCACDRVCDHNWNGFETCGNWISMDAVPVVRCKDCKYSFKNNGHDKGGCPIVDAHIWMDDDGFCSLGERKEGAD